MASTYWMTFRLADDSSYDKRYENLVEAVKSLARGNKWWYEPSSFFVFQNAGNIDTVAAALKKAINPSVDIVFLGMSEVKSARLIGASTDRDIYDLMPFTKKV